MIATRQGKLHACFVALALGTLLAVGLHGAPLLAAENAGDHNGSFTHGTWPFQPVERPAVPVVARTESVLNPIDAFIVAELEAAGLSPNAPADKLTLLRRVTFDLIGLPPTLEEQAAFLDDTSPDAYARVVDRLLASPHYGERWAQHWLDLVRYAETDGFKQDDLRPSAHKYRDYVIQALNSDLPYDQFVKQQLAGDELEPDNPLAVIATGLNRLYPDEYNAANLFQRRQEILDDITDTTGLVFMGLTMGCAQCHDHKFDEILQADYFRLQAFFAPMQPRDDLSAAPRGERINHDQRLLAWEEATWHLRHEMEQLVQTARDKQRQDELTKFDAEILAAVALPEEDRTAYQHQIATMAIKFVSLRDATAYKKLPKAEQARYVELQGKLAAFDHLKPDPLPRAMAIADVSDQAPPTYRLATGNFRKPLEEIQPAFPEFLGNTAADIEPAISVAGAATGRRTALAEWLTRPDHPLTARVMINRVWQHHFGRGIVTTPNDFGAMGEPPTHPRLLDWLAAEFMEQGWSLKHMHRLMLLSATYQQSSLVDADNPAHLLALEKDLNNHLLWHARRRRLEGETIRDAMLAVSGDLNLRMFGPSAHPKLPQGISSTYAWQPDAELADQQRRSIYVLAKRNMRFPLFDAFDLPDMHHSCDRRSNTTTAPQALTLLNSEFSTERAARWHAALLQQHGPDQATWIAAAYQSAWGRHATSEEVELARTFIAEQAARISEASTNVTAAEQDQSRTSAAVDFCHALFNSNAFLHVD